jgi:TonB family protein
MYDNSHGRFKEAAMKLPALVMLLACTTAVVAADSPPAGAYETLPGYAFKPLIEDYYPNASRVLNEQGTTGLKLCYDIRGRPIQVTVEESSGYKRLDEAAVRWSRSVRIRLGTLGGMPRPGCALAHVKFSLEKSLEPSAQDDELLLPLPDVPRIPDSLPPPPPGRFIPLGGEVG